MENIEKRIKVLVLGVGGNVSQGIIKALRNSELNIELIGACISEDSIGLYMCDQAYIAPYANDEKFLDWLITLCNKEEIDIVLTGVEENICAIQEQIVKFNESTKAVFIASDYEKLMIGQDKWKTCQWLKKNGCNYPEYCRMGDISDEEALIQKVGFPLIAKPCVGKSSRGVYLVKNQEQLEEIKKIEKEPYVLQECVGDFESEYTIGCYCDREGRLRDMIIMRRKVKDGSTVWAEVLEHEEIRKEVEKICKLFKPNGPLNVQLRLDKNKRPVCFELNVRFSGTTPVRAHFGYNDVEAMIREYICQESVDTCFQVRQGEVYRYVNEMYVERGASALLKEKGCDKSIASKFSSFEEMKRKES